jgi:hypothetical protein
MSYDPHFHLHSNFPNRWSFRWRFDFHSKDTKRGGWNNSSDRPEDLASFVNKDGCSYARIEGKHFLTREIKIFAEVPGYLFLNFEYLAALISSGASSINFVYGMRIRTEHRLITCFADGSVTDEHWRPYRDFAFPEWTKY